MNTSPKELIAVCPAPGYKAEITYEFLQNPYHIIIRSPTTAHIIRDILLLRCYQVLEISTSKDLDKEFLGYMDALMALEIPPPESIDF